MFEKSNFKNADSELFDAALAYANNPSMLTYTPLKNAIFELEGIKPHYKPVTLSSEVDDSMDNIAASISSSYNQYRVRINFAGFVGADLDYDVEASNPEEAEELAKDLAIDDISVRNVKNAEDGVWEVTVNYGGYVGVEETFAEYGDSEDEAVEAALAEARYSLYAERVFDL